MRLVDHLKGPAWLTCLKLDALGRPQTLRHFHSGTEIIDSRAGILIDQCHKEAYTPFDIRHRRKDQRKIDLIVDAARSA